MAAVVANCKPAATEKRYDAAMKANKVNEMKYLEARNSAEDKIKLLNHALKQQTEG